MATPTLINNAPIAGSISWDDFVVKYEGENYAVDAASTDERWVWWRYNAGSPIIEAGASVPNDLNDDDLVLFANKSGLGVRIQSSNLIDGELIVDGTILADAIGANQIVTEHMEVGTINGDRIMANSLTIGAINDDELQETLDAVYFEAIRSPGILPTADGKTFTNVLSFNVRDASVAGFLVIHTPIIPDAKMMTMRIQGYNYATGFESIDLTVSAYLYQSGLILSHGQVNRGSLRVEARLGVTAGGLLDITIRPLNQSVWQYPSILIPDVSFSWTQPPDEWVTGWSGEYLATEPTYPYSIIPTMTDISEASALTQSWRTTGQTTINGGKITADSITALEIASRTITALEIAVDTITANEIAADSITASEIAAHTITAAEIAADTITANEIASHTITAEEVAADIIVANEIYAQDGYFGSIGAEQINTGELTATLALFGSLNVGGISINDTTGIRIPQPGGGNIIFPTDGTAATFSGILTSIQQLSVSGTTTLNNTVKLNAQLSIGSGVADPVDKVSVTTKWNSKQQMLGSPAVDTEENFWYGLCDNPSGTLWNYVSSTFGTDVRQVNKSDGHYAGQLNLSTTWNGIGGITRSGNFYYILGMDNQGANIGKWRVHKYTAAFDYVSSSGYLTTSTTSTSAQLFSQKRPAIGLGITGIKVVSSSATSLKILTLNASTLAQTSLFNFSHGGAAAFDIAGIYENNNGHTENVSWVQSVGGSCLAYTEAAGTRVPTLEFVRAGGNNPRGLWWDGTRFYNLDSNARVWEYGILTINNTVDLAWAAYDGNATGGTHKSGVSPRTSYYWPARSRLLIETPTPPELHLTGTGTDVADRALVYGGGVGGTLHLVGYGGDNTLPGGALPVGVRTVDTEGFSIIAPTPVANEFAGIGGLGDIRSVAVDGAGALIDLSGSGSGRVGPLSWNTAGTPLTIPGEAQQAVQSSDASPTGTTNITLAGVSITVASPGTTAAYAVTLDADTQILIAGTVNIIELLVDGVAIASPSLILSGAANHRVSQSKRWVVTGLSAGNHTFTARTRNSAGSTSAAVKASHTVLTVIREK